MSCVLFVLQYFNSDTRRIQAARFASSGSRPCFLPRARVLIACCGWHYMIAWPNGVSCLVVVSDQGHKHGHSIVVLSYRDIYVE